MIQDIYVGDVVRVEDDPTPWRVDAKTRAGMLTLEALHSVTRIRWEGVHEFRVVKSAVFS